MPLHSPLSKTPPLVLEAVTKIYPVFRTPLDLVRPRHRDRVRALDQINLRVEDGEVVGIIGHNGAGKSTLLRTIAGISAPTSGTIVRNGTVYPLLDIGAGLNPFLSARRNARQRLKLLGVDPPRMPGLVEEVVEFAELVDVADEPIRTYSTGMRIRLAFAITTATEPEILLIDEVLAVGDEFFAAKSFSRIEELVHGGRAALVASNNWLQTFRLCSRIVWLEHGRIRAVGQPNELMYDYLAEINAFVLSHRNRVTRLEFLDEEGNPTKHIEHGQPLTIRFAWEGNESADIALISEWIDVTTGESILSSWSPDDGFVVSGERRGTIEIRYPELPFGPGAYDYGLALVDPAQGPFPVEHYDQWGPIAGRDTRIVVGSGRDRNAMLHVPVEWEVRSP